MNDNTYTQWLNTLTANGLGSDYGLWLWVFAIAFSLATIAFVVRWLLARLGTQVLKTGTFWDDAFFAAARRPLALLIWVLGLSWIAEAMHVQTGAYIFEYAPDLRRLGILVLLLWFVVAFIREAEKGLIARDAHQSQFDQTTIHAVGKLLRTAVFVTGVLLILQALGYNISSVLAFGSIGGLALSFAAKDLLANFFGGLMVYLDRPFSVGDWIRSPDRDIEGTVEHIGWRSTVIRTFDKRPLYVPNSTFTNIAVENPSRMSNRRIYETIGVRYVDAAKVDSIVTAIKTMLLAHPEIDASQTMIGNQQPATSNQQPATSNQQPATSNQQPATSNQQPATSNQQPATSNQQPATSNQQPATSNQQPWLDKRMSIFERFCLPSVTNQNSKNFTWVIYIDSDTKQKYVKQLERIADAYEYIIIKKADSYDIFLERYCADILSLMDDDCSHIITTRLDNDDVVKADFISTIQQQFNHQDYIVINFVKVLMLNPDNHRKLYIGNQFPSGIFISLIEKIDNGKITGIYAKNFLYMGGEGTIQLIDQPYCAQIISDYNVMSEFRGLPVFKKTSMKDFNIDGEFKARVLDPTNYRILKRYGLKLLSRIFRKNIG